MLVEIVWNCPPSRLHQRIVPGERFGERGRIERHAWTRERNPQRCVDRPHGSDELLGKCRVLQRAIAGGVRIARRLEVELGGAPWLVPEIEVLDTVRRDMVLSPKRFVVGSVERLAIPWFVQVGDEVRRILHCLWRVRAGEPARSPEIDHHRNVCRAHAIALGHVEELLESERHLLPQARHDWPLRERAHGLLPLPRIDWTLRIAQRGLGPFTLPLRRDRKRGTGMAVVVTEHADGVLRIVEARACVEAHPQDQRRARIPHLLDVDRDRVDRSGNRAGQRPRRQCRVRRRAPFEPNEGGEKTIGAWC